VDKPATAIVSAAFSASSERGPDHSDPLTERIADLLVEPMSTPE
jgi:hypothetical protein